jgi:hypothetical protein
MAMRRGAIALLFLGLGAAVAADDTGGKKPAVKVREISLSGLRGEASGSAKKPTEITNADELAKAFPDKAWQKKLAKQVKFDKEKLLFFAWSGSGQDKLTHKVQKGEKGQEVVFQYRPGRTRDLRHHFHLFAVPKDAAWKFGDK